MEEPLFEKYVIFYFYLDDHLDSLIWAIGDVGQCPARISSNLLIVVIDKLEQAGQNRSNVDHFRRRVL